MFVIGQLSGKIRSFSCDALRTKQTDRYPRTDTLALLPEPELTLKNSDRIFQLYTSMYKLQIYIPNTVNETKQTTRVDNNHDHE